MNVFKTIILLFILLLMISSCTYTKKTTNDSNETVTNQINKDNDSQVENLKAEITNLEEQLRKQKEEISTLKLIEDYTMFYKVMTYEQCVVISDAGIRQEPRVLCEPSRFVSCNSLVEVLASIDVLEDDVFKTWLFVKTVTYDDPYNNVGWIEEEKTTLLTEENRFSIISPIRLKEGCTYLDNSNQKVDFDKDYFIIKIEGDIAYIGSAGGWYTSINKKYIKYPEPKE